MNPDVERAYETLHRHGHFPFMVMRVDEVKEYISEYAQSIVAPDDVLIKAILKTWSLWDSSEDWRYAVEHVMHEIEQMESAQ